MLNAIPASSTRGLFLSGIVFLVSLAYPTGSFSQEEADPPYLVDMFLAVEARQALYKDPQLGPLNLGVRVHQRVAVLWGPVPSAELAKKALRCLNRLYGLRSVVDRLTVVSEEPAIIARPAQPQFLPAPKKRR